MWVIKVKSCSWSCNTQLNIIYYSVLDDPWTNTALGIVDKTVLNRFFKWSSVHFFNFKKQHDLRERERHTHTERQRDTEKQRERERQRSLRQTENRRMRDERNKA